MQCDQCQRELPPNETYCVFCDRDAAASQSTSAGPALPEPSKPPAPAPKRTSSEGSYAEWQATCPKCENVFDRDSLPCPNCGKPLWAWYSLTYRGNTPDDPNYYYYTSVSM